MEKQWLRDTLTNFKDVWVKFCVFLSRESVAKIPKTVDSVTFVFR